MGMECSAIHVMLLTQNDEIVSWNLDLANEMQADLVGNADLFLSFSNAGTFAGCIGKGFKDYYEEEPSKKNFIKQYCDDFYENGYKELQKKVKAVVKDTDVKSAFKKVVLLSNTPTDGSRDYKWNLFDLSTNTFKCGEQLIKYISGRYGDTYAGDPNPEDFMKALIQE